MGGYYKSIPKPMSQQPTNRQGYARKQARPLFDKSELLQETRACIKIYNEEDLPLKRPKPSESEQPSKGFDKFCLYVDKLESLFNSSTTSAPISEPDKPQTEDILDLSIPALSPQEQLKNFAIDLDKATKFTNSQLKVLEKYGIEWNPEPWKFEPRFRQPNPPPERGLFGNRRGNFRKSRHRHNPTRVVRRFDEINIEELWNDLPPHLRTWNITKGFVLKKLKTEVSIRKDVIAQGKVF